MLYVRILVICSLFTVLSGLSSSAQAQTPSPAAAMRRLLESGRVPVQRLPAIVKMISERGTADDLNYLFQQVATNSEWPASLKAETLDWLTVAAIQRKVVPQSDGNGLEDLLKTEDMAILRPAIELAGLWQVKSAAPRLQQLASASETKPEVRQLALKSLSALDPALSRTLLTELATQGTTFKQRLLGASELAALDARAAAPLAARILQSAGPHDDPTPLLDAFLNLKQGSDLLAAELKQVPPTKDQAKLLLRHMFSLGRTDATLNQVLSGLAGMDQAIPTPTAEELRALVEEANQHGDPARGEAVFRRTELSCMNCHAVSGGGGQIGPDLSAIGASSPGEYLISSVLDPDQAIKEAFTTKLIATVDGKVLQGIIASRTADSLVLKDATGKLIAIPLADIDEEIEGKSLMPKGLVNFMTHAEFVDLIAFLGALGKPGDYAIRSTARMQRYRVLVPTPENLREPNSIVTNFEETVLDSANWIPCYAKVNGQLPLNTLTTKAESPVVFVRGEVSCSAAGPVTLALQTSARTQVWLDDEDLGAVSTATVQLEPGKHAVIVRVDTSGQPEAQLQMEFKKPSGSSAEFVVVDGQ
jgi:putative heme-binding domain-containing protein